MKLRVLAALAALTLPVMGAQAAIVNVQFSGSKGSDSVLGAFSYDTSIASGFSATETNYQTDSYFQTLPFTWTLNGQSGSTGYRLGIIDSFNAAGGADGFLASAQLSSRSSVSFTIDAASSAFIGSTALPTSFAGAGAFSYQYAQTTTTIPVSFSFSSAVPEPASWALMIGGVAVAGGSLRRRARRAIAA